MEKISGILPNSARVGAVDLKSTPALRPGVPSFGRPIGISTLNQEAPDTATRATQRHQELMDLRSKKDEHSQIIKDLSQNFFMKKAKGPTPVSQPTPAQTSLPTEVGEPVTALPTSPVVEASDPEVDWEAPLVGRYLDVAV